MIRAFLEAIYALDEYITFVFNVSVSSGFSFDTILHRASSISSEMTFIYPDAALVPHLVSLTGVKKINRFAITIVIARK